MAAAAAVVGDTAVATFAAADAAVACRSTCNRYRSQRVFGTSSILWFAWAVFVSMFSNIRDGT